MNFADYYLPQATYKRVLWTIRDVYNKQLLRESILEASPPPPDGQPRGTGTSDTTASKAVKLAGIPTQEAVAIEAAKKEIPRRYIQGVWDHITKSTPYPPNASRKTYNRWQRVFIWHCAYQLGWI